jgi:membrane dipeptidase
MADCHDDLLMAVRHLRERGHADPFGDFWLPQLRQGGVAVQMLPVYTEEQFVGEAALRRCLLLIEEAYHLADVHRADVSLVHTSADLRAALDQGRIALVLALEGAEPVGNDLAVLHALFRCGIRMSSLTWNRRTMMADGVGEHDTGGRLTGLGVETVAEMQRLGMVVDVSHLSDAGFWHLMSVATGPIVASHSSCRALRDHPRNLSDDQIRALAETGGFVAINSFGPFLGEEPDLQTYIDHVEHAVNLVGAHHVALGLDFMADVSRIVDPVLTGALMNAADLPVLPDLARPADLAGLGDAMCVRLGPERAAQVAHQTMTDFLLKALPA